jgi:hypothetical protein
MMRLLRAALTADQLRALYDGARAKARRIVVMIVVGTVAGVCGAAALIWLDIALYFYCLPRFGPPIAALIAAGAFMLVALIALVPLALTSSPRTRPRRSPGVDQSTAAALHDLTELAKRNKGAILVAAALSGLLLGTKRR